MTTEAQTAAGSIVLVTTADTDILTAERALVGMPWGDAVSVHAFNPVALEGESDRRQPPALNCWRPSTPPPW